MRPEVHLVLQRYAEVIAAGAAGLFGAWLVWLGGYLLLPLGLFLIAIAALWALQALRRLSFVREVEAPGLVEVDEGQIGYLGPTFGGYLALPELVELRRVTLYRQQLWRLKQADGQAMLIPLGARGAEKLFDAFAALPGIDMQALAAAASSEGSDTVVWRKEAVGGNVRYLNR
jgi:hypothetical protein